MQYADFSYYYDSFCGRKIADCETFNSLAVRAQAYVNRITFGRAAEAAESEGVKNAVCAVCEVLYVQDSRDGISSETNDGYSIVYKSNAQAQRQKLYEAAALHLAPELLYRGAAL